MRAPSHDEAICLVARPASERLARVIRQDHDPALGVNNGDLYGLM